MEPKKTIDVLIAHASVHEMEARLAVLLLAREYTTAGTVANASARLVTALENLSAAKALHECARNLNSGVADPGMA